jgi:hypothetical protein
VKLVYDILEVIFHLAAMAASSMTFWTLATTTKVMKSRMPLQVTSKGTLLHILLMHYGTWIRELPITRLVSERGKLSAQEPYGGHDQVRTVNGAGMHISYIGQVSLLTHNSEKRCWTGAVFVDLACQYIMVGLSSVVP